LAQGLGRACLRLCSMASGGYSGGGYKLSEEIEYLSKSHGNWIKTTVQIVHTDGTIEVACKMGLRIPMGSGDVRHSVPTASLADSPVRGGSRFQKGEEALYHSGSLGKWIPCSITDVRADGAVQINVKPGAWLKDGDAASTLRRKPGSGGGSGAIDDQLPPSDEGHGGEENWELIEKAGFLSGPAEDMVGSPEEARRKVLANPGDYMGYTVSIPPGQAYVRKQGSTLVGVGSFKCYVLSCKPLDYKGKLFEDQYTTNATRFSGGLANGKGGNNQVAWKRAGRGEGLLDRPGLKLFGGIEPNDLKQGSVGDCSLIAAIACLCEFPELVRKLFSRHTVSEQGRYDITLWDWGKRDWITLAIDDRFASKDKDSPEPLFVKASEDQELYPMLIEKAVAIMAGGFDFMSSIMPPWALAVLTGNPDVWHFTAQGGQWKGSRPVYDGTSTYQSVQNVTEGCWPDGSDGGRTKSNAEMWECMRQWDEKDYMAICGSAAQGKSDSSSLPCGIIYMHAYSIIEVKSNIAGSGINLAQVRNPHGAGGQEPNLKWKDNDQMWKTHPKVADACGIGETGFEEDGLFWIDDKDFFGPNSEHYNSIYLVKGSARKRPAKAEGHRRR